MNIVEKLTSIDQSKITNNGLVQNINTAIATIGDQHTDLTATELSAYQKLYDRAVEHVKKNEEAQAAEEKRKQEEVEKKRKSDEASAQAEEKRKRDEEAAKTESERKKQEEQRKQEQLKIENQKQLNLKTMIENLTIPHLSYLDSKGLSMNSMPTEIKNKSVGFNTLYGKLKKDPTNENLKQQVIGKSNELLSMIQTMETKQSQESQVNEEKRKADEAAAQAEEKRKSDEASAQAEEKRKADEVVAQAEEKRKADEAAVQAKQEEEKKRKGTYGNPMLKSIFGV